MAIDELPGTLPQPCDSQTLRRRELGAFLRSRRERMTPTEIGLASVGRRRTPGLRREEVAALAGVGVTWYTWLEQGRDIHASDAVLEAIGRTLRLDVVERRHLFALAGSSAPPADQECAVVTPALRAILDRLDPIPAAVLNGRFDVLAYNRTYATLVADLDEIDPEDRNTLWLNLTHPMWRRAVVDWEDAVARCVGQLRASMAEHVAEPAWAALVARLSSASPEFVEMWERHEVRSMEVSRKALLNDRVGLLRFETTTLWLGLGAGTRLLAYGPSDPETVERLRLLAR